MQLRQMLLPLSFGITTLLAFNMTAGTGSARSQLEAALAQQFNCNNPQTQAEMNACAGLNYQDADKKLNQVYQQLIPKLSPDRRARLTDAQLAWIKFRDANCLFERSAVEGGTMAPAIQGGCLAQLTEKRTTDFQSYIRGQILPATTRNLQAADRKLNQVYQQLISQVGSQRPERGEKLREAEQAWIAFRDANCRFESTQSSEANNTCLTRMSEQRTQELLGSIETP